MPFKRLIKILKIKHKGRLLTLSIMLSLYNIRIKKGTANKHLGSECVPLKAPLTKKEQILIFWYQQNLPKLIKRLPFYCSCLTQALAVRYLLKQHGIPIYLALGVKNTQDLEAHAWLTINHITINCGSNPNQFTVLPKLFQL